MIKINNNFGLVVIGAHTGEFLIDEIKLYNDRPCLLIEPVPYNFKKLKFNTKSFKNINYCNNAISDENILNKFYHVKENSIKKLGKHWASGIGSFKKKHLIDHRYKRFKIEDDDIEIIDVKFITFDDLINDYSINSIEKLQIDVEGGEFKIMNSIDFNKIKINEIVFECKHFDGTFKEGEKLEKIINFLSSKNYDVKRMDKENMIAKKVTINS